MKIKNILSSSPATESQLTEFRVNRTLKKGVKIEKVEPSYPGQHWVDLNNYHINKILGEENKFG